ncbi:hypothetical protein EF405_04925 [Cyclobacteriaceae bacterium YHN15]|nr:hypothetical protein EF405_04925 [Cyclobacteriaceae bacterium YHN15]
MVVVVVGYIYGSIESGAATQEKSPCHSYSLKSAFTERKKTIGFTQRTQRIRSDRRVKFLPVIGPKERFADTIYNALNRFLPPWRTRLYVTSDRNVRHSDEGRVSLMMGRSFILVPRIQDDGSLDVILISVHHTNVKNPK